MRRKILGLMLYLCSVAGFTGEVYSQNWAGARMHPAILLLLQQIAEDQDEAHSGNEEFLEEVAGYLESLMNNGEEPDKEGIRRLGQHGLLDPFEVAVFYSYIDKYGKPSSIAEFLLVPEVDKQKLKLLCPFIRLEINDREEKKRVRSQVLLRSSVSPDNPFLLYSKATAELPGMVSVVAVAERDPGEKGVDYFSWGAGFSGNGFLKKLVLGSYTAREGQGLILWNGFFLNTVSDPAGYIKRDYDPAPYGSADENRAFRGAAATFGVGKWIADIMFSSRGIDARIVSGGYTSLLTTGIHDTKVARERKKSLYREMVAATLSYEAPTVRLGFVFAGMDESHLYAGKDSFELATAASAGNKRGNISFHWKKIYKNLLWYGESALDICNRIAFVSGVSARNSEGSIISLMANFRNAGFSSPFSTVKVPGKDGFPSLNLSAGTKVNNLVNLTFYAAIAKDYFKLSLKAENDKFSARNYVFLTTLTKERLVSRIDYRLNPSDKLLLHTRAQMSLAGTDGTYSFGYNVHQEAVLTLGHAGVDVSSRIAWFSAAKWKNRLYSYERDILYQFRTSLLYGEGLRWYINFNWSLSERLRLWFKYASFLYTGNIKKSEFKIQLRIKL